MARVGQQTHGVADESGHGLGGHEEEVDDDGHNIYGAHLAGVDMMVVMMMVMVAAFVVRMVVSAVVGGVLVMHSVVF